MSQYECRECKSPLMPTPSGSTCPNGCIGIMPKLPRDAERLNVARLGGMPVAEPALGKFTIPGHSGVYERGRIAVANVQKLLEGRDSKVYAIEGGKIREFEPVK
jgi:hypothetical protein